MISIVLAFLLGVICAAPYYFDKGYKEAMKESK